jgi:hypothetical protein
MLRSITLADAGSFLTWRTALADAENPTSADLETKFLAGPLVIDLTLGGKVAPRCIAAVTAKSSGKPVFGATSASLAGECPTNIGSYYEKSDLVSDSARESFFDKSKAFNVRVVEGRSRLLYTYPGATTNSSVNPTTGKQEFEAYCFTFTYLDPRIHKGDPDLKMIFYQRMPTPEKLTSLDDKVTCGDINYAYENEIKTRKPTALRNFADDTVPHNSLSAREKSSLPASVNDSRHKSK